MTRRIALALVHYPILDKAGAVVTTSITNLDVHDIARSTYTYGISPYFVVHPVAGQRELVEHVKAHWTEGSGARRIPDRKPPLGNVEIVDGLETARRTLSADAELWVTSAKQIDGALEHDVAHRRLVADGPPVLLVFGTGWGLADSVLEAATVALAPIRSPRPDGYNHLSVRAAVAILLDRLLGGPSRGGV
ncbi:MAG TPA: RNA methyltransferase [Polyangiaceae bacterium]|nr:RNA methyltransferase [Polyangiaceae bacterium]